MPSFQDTALIALIALLLFGPKKLPELARQLGKLMAEFRRASNEFRMQMEDELRVSEQEEQQKKIAAMEAAAPKAAPLLEDESDESMVGGHLNGLDGLNHPHMPAEESFGESIGEVGPVTENTIAAPAVAEAEGALPIASSGELDMMPPATGLPVGRSASSSSLLPVLNAIPHTTEMETAELPTAEQSAHEAQVHG
jgi:sec-independent protein translocase protein TatB